MSLRRSLVLGVWRGGRWLQRERRRELDLLERDVRLDLRYTLNLGQPLLQESLVGCHVGNDDPQEVVGFTAHQIAFQDFRTLGDGFLEDFDTALRLLVERNLDEDGDADVQ